MVGRVDILGGLVALSFFSLALDKMDDGVLTSAILISGNFAAGLRKGDLFLLGNFFFSVSFFALGLEGSFEVFN